MKGIAFLSALCFLLISLLIGNYNCGRSSDAEHNYKIIIQPEGVTITATSGTILNQMYFVDLTDDNKSVPNAGLNITSSIGPPKIELFNPVTNDSSSPLIIRTDDSGTGKFKVKITVDSNYTTTITASFGSATTSTSIDVELL